MKKINPLTNKFYKRGDYNPDTEMYFFKFEKSKLDKEGFFRLHWLHKKTFDRAVKAINNAGKSIVRQKNEGLLKGKKRHNPETKKPFIMGEKFHGKYFLNYDLRFVNKYGFFREEWLDEKKMHRKRVQNRLTNLRNVSRRKNLPFNLDIEYLLEIFPKNYICPVLGIKMSWGGFKKTKGPSMESPSIDRIKTSKGYIKSNVSWMSMRANYIKQDASSRELKTIAKWMKKKGL